MQSQLIFGYNAVYNFCGLTNNLSVACRLSVTRDLQAEILWYQSISKVTKCMQSKLI